jgi:hypothetical protein
MNRFWITILVLCGALALAPSVSFAEGTRQQVSQRWRRWQRLPHGEPVASVPELDPGAAAQALTLLLGAGALMIERSRRRPATA